MGSTIHFGSRTQSTIALSSAEAELYAINTGATEALHIRSFLTEALTKKKVNIKIYTDSSSGKSIATRIGSSKKAKHIELKHLFIQQLVLNDIVGIIKINTLANPADIFTKYVATEVGINTQAYWTLASTWNSFTWLRSAYRTTTSITLRAHTLQHTHTHPFAPWTALNFNREYINMILLYTFVFFTFLLNMLATWLKTFVNMLF